MNDLLISLLVFAVIFGGALLGVVLRHLLSESHLQPDSKDCKNGDGPDRHTGRAGIGPVDRIRENLVRPEGQPGQATDRYHHCSRRSASAIWAGSGSAPNASAAEHSAAGGSYLA